MANRHFRLDNVSGRRAIERQGQSPVADSGNKLVLRSRNGNSIPLNKTLKQRSLWQCPQNFIGLIFRKFSDAIIDTSRFDIFWTK